MTEQITLKKALELVRFTFDETERPMINQFPALCKELAQ
jgi:hypothetical protein